MTCAISIPVSIGFASRLVVADCLRKWCAGAVLTQRERQIVDAALAGNRIEMLATVFDEREAGHAG